MKTIFVDRRNEMNSVRKQLSASGRKVLILLGDGGIGKTRFLQEVKRVVSKEYEKMSIDTLMWWDFDEYIQKDRPEIYIKNKFLDASGLIESVSDPHNIDFTEIAQRINKNPKRKLLLFDTLEKLSDPRIKSGLFKLISDLNNAVFIFAGRPIKENDRKQKFDYEDFLLKTKELDPGFEIITLKVFDQKSALEYISAKSKLRRMFISIDDKKKLAKLSGGVPILLDLATDYLANNIQIPNPITKASNFETYLVQQVNKLKTPLDLAILILSVVNPLDVVALTKMLDVNDPESFFEKLKNLSFVKVLPDGQVILHDKMEDLVIEHVWKDKNLKPSPEFEEQVLRKAFEIFKERDRQLTSERRLLKDKIKIGDLSPRELVRLTRELDVVTAAREVVTQKWVRYGLALGIDFIWSDFVNLISDIRKGKKSEFTQKLVNEVNNPFFPNRDPYWKKLNPEQLYDFLIIRARNKRDIGDLDKAIEDLETLLRKYGKDINKRHAILNILASTQTQTGRLKYLRRAVRNHKETLGIIDSKYLKSRDFKYLLDKANIENQLGYTYRLLEDDDADAYDRAGGHYIQGREFALKYKEYLNKKLKTKLDPKQKSILNQEVVTVNRTLAAINNGLGYVQGRQRHYDDAYYHIDEAIWIWAQTGDTREIARAITSKAILKRDQGKFEEASELFSDALELPHAKDDQLILSRVYHHKGWNEWELASKVGFDKYEGLRLLEQAHLSLDNSIKSLGADSKYVRELSGVYHNISEMKWKLGQLYKNNGEHKKGSQFLVDAMTSNRRAIELSKEAGNNRYLVDALVGQAQYALDMRDYKMVERYFTEVKAFEKKHPQFGLFYGRMYRLIGDALFLQKKLDKAFEMYEKAFPLIYRNKPGEGSYGFIEEQQLLIKKMNKLSIQKARKYYEYLRSAWSKDTQNIRLFDWCDKEVDRLRKDEEVANEH